MPRGGVRNGAGRPAGSGNKAQGLARDLAHDLLGSESEQKQRWESLLGAAQAAGDLRVRFDTLKYLTDRAYGRPRESMSLSTDLEPFKIIVEHVGG
jgi:hypothetical protein